MLGPNPPNLQTYIAVFGIWITFVRCRGQANFVMKGFELVTGMKIAQSRRAPQGAARYHELLTVGPCARDDSEGCLGSRPVAEDFVQRLFV